jgi:hypothetical protein
MYNDYRNTNRTEWKFIYTGEQLLEAARRKHAEFLEKEKKARETMASLMMDMSVAQSDGRIAECKEEIETSGTEREKCAVWAHEFARRPEREYFLQLGDVTYFGLAVEPQ